MTTLCSANQLRTPDRCSLEDLVDPRPGCIDNYLSLSDLFLPIFTNKFDARNLPIFNGKIRHARMREHFGAKLARRQYIREHKTFGKLNLRIVIQR